MKRTRNASSSRGTAKRGRLRKDLLAEESAQRGGLLVEFQGSLELLGKTFALETQSLKDTLITKYRKLWLDQQRDFQEKQNEMEKQWRAVTEGLSVIAQMSKSDSSRPTISTKTTGYSVRDVLHSLHQEIREELQSRDKEIQRLMCRCRDLESAAVGALQQASASESKLRAVLVDDGPLRDPTYLVVSEFLSALEQRFSENLREMNAALRKLIQDSALVGYEHRQYSIISARDEVKEDFVSRMQRAAAVQEDLLSWGRNYLQSHYSNRLQERVAEGMDEEGVIGATSLLSPDVVETLNNRRPEELVAILNRCAVWPQVHAFVNAVANAHCTESDTGASASASVLSAPMKDLNPRNELQRYLSDGYHKNEFQARRYAREKVERALEPAKADSQGAMLVPMKPVSSESAFFKRQLRDLFEDLK
jgi:hypothetical protein